MRIYNPRGEALTNVAVALSSEYPTVTLLSNAVTVPRIEPGGVADLTSKFAVKFTAGAGYFAPTLLNLKLTYDGWHESLEDIDVLVTPDRVPAPVAYQIMDGRTVTLPVFRQKGNQGGGSGVPRSITEGKGNGNGRLEPGEEATIWVRLDQGLDPFDKGNWYRAKVYSDSPWITEPARLEEEKQLEWTSARERTSVIRLAAGTPPGTEISLAARQRKLELHIHAGRALRQRAALPGLSTPPASPAPAHVRHRRGVSGRGKPNLK